MIKLRLKDGTEYTVTDNSTIDEFAMVLPSMKDYVDIYDAMTDDNLSDVSIGDETYLDRVLIGTSTSRIGNKIEAHFSTGSTTQRAEIEALESRVVGLEAQVAESSDKAEAFDYIMNGGDEA